MTAQTNREKFRECYIIALTQEVTAEPLKYVFDLEQVPYVAGLMIAALAKGSANKDSLALKRTCKALDIKYTYQAIREYLNEEPHDDNPTQA